MSWCEEEPGHCFCLCVASLFGRVVKMLHVLCLSDIWAWPECRDRAGHWPECDWESAVSLHWDWGPGLPTHSLRTPTVYKTVLTRPLTILHTPFIPSSDMLKKHHIKNHPKVLSDTFVSNSNSLLFEWIHLQQNGNVILIFFKKTQTIYNRFLLGKPQTD